MDVDAFAPNLHLSEFVIDVTKYILKTVWSDYREHFNRIKSECIVLAAILLACELNEFELDDDVDIYRFLKDNFKEDVQKMSVNMYKANFRMKEIFGMEV